MIKRKKLFENEAYLCKYFSVVIINFSFHREKENKEENKDFRSPVRLKFFFKRLQKLLKYL